MQPWQVALIAGAAVAAFFMLSTATTPSFRVGDCFTTPLGEMSFYDVHRCASKFGVIKP